MLFFIVLCVLYGTPGYILGAEIKKNSQLSSSALVRLALAIAIWFACFIMHLVITQVIDPFLTATASGATLMSGGALFFASKPSTELQSATIPNRSKPLATTRKRPSVNASVTPPNQPDAYSQAGQELLDSNISPGIWAKALVESDGSENGVRATYIKLRVLELESEYERQAEALRAAEADVAKCRESLNAYGETQCRMLAEVLRSATLETMRETRDSIYWKSGWPPPDGNPRVFLQLFFERLRERLETPGTMSGR